MSRAPHPMLAGLTRAGGAAARLAKSFEESDRALDAFEVDLEDHPLVATGLWDDLFGDAEVEAMPEALARLASAGLSKPEARQVARSPRTGPVRSRLEAGEAEAAAAVEAALRAVEEAEAEEAVRTRGGRGAEARPAAEAREAASGSRREAEAVGSGKPLPPGGPEVEARGRAVVRRPPARGGAQGPRDLAEVERARRRATELPAPSISDGRARIRLDDAADQPLRKHHAPGQDEARAAPAPAHAEVEAVRRILEGLPLTEAPAAADRAALPMAQAEQRIEAALARLPEPERAEGRRASHPTAASFSPPPRAIPPASGLSGRSRAVAAEPTVAPMRDTGLSRLLERGQRAKLPPVVAARSVEPAGNVPWPPAAPFAAALPRLQGAYGSGGAGPAPAHASAEPGSRSQRPDPAPFAAAAQAEDSEAKARELAELLRREARRAGIDLKGGLS